MRISVAIIVKNEESVMQRCLDCVEKFADDIVIVDTGSTDGTKEIAGRHPKVRLFDSELFNYETHISDFSFSLAKNEAIEKCDGDWIVWWDADDCIDEEGARRIREISDNERRICIFGFTVVSGGVRFEHLRMFPNGSGILFDSAHSCHEFLDTKGNLLIHYRELEVVHSPVKRDIPSSVRNLAILEKDHHQRGMNDQRTLFYLANAYKESGRHEEAVEFYDKYLEVSEWSEERFFARYYKSNCFIALARFEDSRRESLKAIIEDFRFAEPYCRLGDLATKDLDWKRAKCWFEMAKNTPFPLDVQLFASEYYYEDYPNLRIFECDSKMNLVVSAQDEESKKKVMKFLLPIDRGNAFLACMGLSCKPDDLDILVFSSDEWIKDLVRIIPNLNLSEDLKPDDFTELELPKSFKGIHVSEWYCRAAGFFVDQVDFQLPKDKDGDDILLIFGDRWGNSRWSALKSSMKDKPVKVLKGESFSEVSKAMSGASLCVVESDWCHHLAHAMGVPAVVLWESEKSDLFGWQEQENTVSPNGSGLESLTARTVHSVVERSIRNGS